MSDRTQVPYNRDDRPVSTDDTEAASASTYIVAEPNSGVRCDDVPFGLLLRPADPPLTRLYVEPTTTCNLDCRTCVRHSWEETGGTMNMATWRNLRDGMAATGTVRKASFWGFGEPLLHPHLPLMIEQTHALGVQTEVISNALLLDRRRATELLHAGLDRLVVSIDGASAEAYQDVRSGADFDRVVKNVMGLQQLKLAADSEKPELAIEFVALRSNVSELTQLRRLAMEIGAVSIIVTNVLPYTREMTNETLYDWGVGKTKHRQKTCWSPEIVLPIMDTRGPAGTALGRLMEYIEGREGEMRDLSNEGAYCKFVDEGSLAVGWNGDLSPCVALMHTYTCYVLGREKRIRRYVVGNINERSLQEVWQEHSFRDFRRRVRDFTFSPCAHCGGCQFAEGNEEDCFGNPFPVCGDCLWARGAIQCP